MQRKTFLVSLCCSKYHSTHSLAQLAVCVGVTPLVGKLAF